MVFNLCVGGLDKRKRPPRFVCSGTLGTDYLYAEETAADGTVNWELAFLKSCSVTFSRVPDADLFLVAGGNPGSGGNGGRGGNRLTLRAVKIDANVEYTVTIGGSGAPTSAGSASTADSGAESGAAGGYGGWVESGGQHHATAGGNGAYAFGESTSMIPQLSGRRYAPGGGGGGFRNEAWVYANNAAGGTTGGGVGGSLNSKNGGNGDGNTGSGGGGRCRDTQEGDGNVGAGGSGIVILRNARGEGA